MQFKGLGVKHADLLPPCLAFIIITRSLGINAETEAGSTVGLFLDPWWPTPLPFLLPRRSHPGWASVDFWGLGLGWFSRSQGSLIWKSFTFLVSPRLCLAVCPGLIIYLLYGIKARHHLTAACPEQSQALLPTRSGLGAGFIFLASSSWLWGGSLWAALQAGEWQECGACLPATSILSVVEAQVGSR